MPQSTAPSVFVRAFSSRPKSKLGHIPRAARALRRTAGRGAMGFYRMSEVKRHYDLLETLGSGNSAIVKRATRLQPSSEVDIPEHVAIKIIDKAKVDDMLDIRVRLLAPVPVPVRLRGQWEFLRRLPCGASAKSISWRVSLTPTSSHSTRSMTSRRRCTWSWSWSMGASYLTR